MSEKQQADVRRQVQQWLEDVVIGLNLCPFAAKPNRNKQIKIQVCESADEEQVLEAIYQEIRLLDETPASELETTLVVTPNLFAEFADYNQFLDLIDILITQTGNDGTYQVASFHPDYCFFGAEPDDAENLTNRSPFPIFHLIREESIEKVLRHYPNPEDIPDRNIECVRNLTPQQIKKLFPFLIK